MKTHPSFTPTSPFLFSPSCSRVFILIVLPWHSRKKTRNSLKVKYCPRNPKKSTRPRRDFIEKRYVELKKANPDLPILIRECSDVQPKLWARYAFGQEKNVSLNNFNADQVTRTLENVLSGKA
uniref:NADH dehydrogenase [ubiquinone] 1 alpha subcomplex subunit 2 n=1 Tax=Spermophilus dauricus TaxID=99837 RepID=A0A8C9PXU6_SPEDA